MSKREVEPRLLATGKDKTGLTRRGIDNCYVGYSRNNGGSLRGFEQVRGYLPGRGLAMAHEIAKLLLEKAGTFLERTEAIKAALQLGMPLDEIQEYLDWLDSIRSLNARAHQPSSGHEPTQAERFFG